VSTSVRPMIDTHPAETGIDRALLARAVDAMTACASVCTTCADACLAEEMVADLRRCIRTDLDCADVCATAARVMTRQTGYEPEVSRAVVQACLVACRTCAAECEEHAGMHEHCRICAEACRTCEQVCEELLRAMG
jgi:hypothetical protein